MNGIGWRMGVIWALLFPLRIAPAADLLTIYQQSMENAPALKAAAAERLAKQEALPQARALWLPRLDLNANVATSRWEPESGPADDYRSHGYGLSVTQTLYNRAAWIQVGQAKERVGQAEVSYEAAHQSLVMEVAQRYFDLLAALDTLEFVKAEKAAIARQLRQVQRRFEVGVSAITDVQEVQARHDSVLSREITARNRLHSAGEALQELTGRANPQLNPLSAELPLLPPEPHDIEAWVRIARESNLQLKVARYAVRVAEAEIRRLSAIRRPSLNLVGSYQRSETGALRFVDNDLATLSLQLDFPLYQGGSIGSRAREARYRYQQANDELEGTLRSTLRATRDAYRNVLAAIARVRALEQSLVSHQTALQATQTGFEVGTRTIVDVLNVQQELFGARRDHAVAHYDYLLAMLRLKQAAGTLDVADLEWVNRWLE